MKKCIILANGKSTVKKIISYLTNKNYHLLICADGGANHAHKLNLMPGYIVGDLDSISAKSLQYYKTKSKIVKLSRQNDTDVEKALKLAVRLGYNETVLLGVTGDRLDHTLCNLGIVIKFYSKIKCIIIAENSILIPVTGKNVFKSIPGETISVYGFDKRTKITSEGLKYSLKKTSLPFGEKESTSNQATSSEVKINVEGGIVFLIRDINFIKQHDLF